MGVAHSFCYILLIYVVSHLQRRNCLHENFNTQIIDASRFWSTMYTHILIGLWAVGMLSCLFVFTFISDAISSLENNLWIPWSLKGWQHTCKACCDLIGQRCFIESQPNTMFGKEHFQRHGTVWFQRCIPDAHWETGRNLIKSQFNIMFCQWKVKITNNSAFLVCIHP